MVMGDNSTFYFATDVNKERALNEVAPRTDHRMDARFLSPERDGASREWGYVGMFV